jgi:ubiquinol-cytochrome c reductase cytochrome b subunit
MTTVFAVLVALAALFMFVKGRMSGLSRAVMIVAAGVAIILLKTFDAKFWGVVVMGAAVIIMFFLPWLDQSPVRSIRYRPGWHKWVYGIFVVFFFVLGYLGIQPPSEGKTLLAQVGTIYYFGFFLLMPWWSRLGAFKPVPDRITFAAH